MVHPIVDSLVPLGDLGQGHIENHAREGYRCSVIGPLTGPLVWELYTFPFGDSKGQCASLRSMEGSTFWWWGQFEGFGNAWTIAAWHTVLG